MEVMPDTHTETSGSRERDAGTFFADASTESTPNTVNAPQLFSSGDGAKLAKCSVTTLKRIVDERRLPEVRTPSGLRLFPASTITAVRNELDRRQKTREALG